MPDEVVNEFDYVLPWWRHIVALSETRRQMFMLREDSVLRLMEAAKILQAKLVSSPLWEMMKNDPTIVAFVSAIGDIEVQLQKKEMIPDEKQKEKNES